MHNHEPYTELLEYVKMNEQMLSILAKLCHRSEESVLSTLYGFHREFSLREIYKICVALNLDPLAFVERKLVLKRSED